MERKMGSVSEGVNLIREGKLEAALKYFQALTESEPLNDGAFRFLGKCFAELGNKRRALLAIEEAIKLNNEQPMWLYRLLVENKLTFVYIEEAEAFLSKKVCTILKDPKKLALTLGLNELNTSASNPSDGALGKRIIEKAIIDKNIRFLSPKSGNIVATCYLFTDDAYYFKDENFILSFFSDWANPFLNYQLFIPEENTVVYGYLDLDSKLHNYSHSPAPFIMYFANLLRVMSQYSQDIEQYLIEENANSTPKCTTPQIRPPCVIHRIPLLVA